MSRVTLAPAEREQLRGLVRHTRQTPVLRRALALLALDQGEGVPAVAQRHGVGRSTVYDWVQRWRRRRREPLAQRLADRPRAGRPAQQRQAVQTLIRAVIGTDPRTLGYRAPSWTTPLLRQHLRRTQEVTVSPRTVRRALHDLGYRYKRPRYVLARRAPHWRQAKGGSSAG